MRQALDIAATGMEFIQVYRCIHNGPFNPAPAEIIVADDQRLTEA